jgi:hypothetical protein
MARFARIGCVDDDFGRSGTVDSGDNSGRKCRGIDLAEHPDAAAVLQALHDKGIPTEDAEITTHGYGYGADAVAIGSRSPLLRVFSSRARRSRRTSMLGCALDAGCATR